MENNIITHYYNEGSGRGEGEYRTQNCATAYIPIIGITLNAVIRAGGWFLNKEKHTLDTERLILHIHTQ